MGRSLSAIGLSRFLPRVQWLIIVVGLPVVAQERGREEEIVVTFRGSDAKCVLEVSIPSADTKFGENLKVEGSTFKVVAQVHTREKEKDCISNTNPAKQKITLNFHSFVELNTGEKREGFKKFEFTRNVMSSPDNFSFDSDKAGLKLTTDDILSAIIGDAVEAGGGKDGTLVAGAQIKLTVEAQVFETGKCACSDGASFFIANARVPAAKGNHQCAIELTIKSLRIFKLDTGDAVLYTFEITVQAEKKGATDDVRFTCSLQARQKYKCDGATKESTKDRSDTKTGVLNPATATFRIDAAFLKKAPIEGKECDIVLSGDALSFSVDCTVAIVQSGENAEFCSDYAHVDGTADPSKTK